MVKSHHQITARRTALVNETAVVWWPQFQAIPGVHLVARITLNKNQLPFL